MSFQHIMGWQKNFIFKNHIFCKTLSQSLVLGSKWLTASRLLMLTYFLQPQLKLPHIHPKSPNRPTSVEENKIKIKFLRPNTGALQLTNHALKIVIAIFAIKPFGLPPQNKKKTHYEIFGFYFCERIFEQFNWVSLALLERKWKRRVYHWPLQVQTFLLSWYN